MEFRIKPFSAKHALVRARTGCIAVGIYENQKLSPAAEILDVGGMLSSAVASGDITGKAGSTLLLRGIPGVSAKRVLLVGLGMLSAVSETGYDTALLAVCMEFAALGCSDVTLALPCDVVPGRDTAWTVARAVELMRQCLHRRDACKSKKDAPVIAVQNIDIMGPITAANRVSLAHAIAVADGVAMAKNLGDLPPNICTPSYLAITARRLAQDYGFAVEVLERDQLEILKMESFLAVSRGSAEAPRLIVLKHLGGKPDEAPVVLVGKGITFDSGGISLKPAASMDEMKYDMGGAAAVLGVFRALGELLPRQNVIGVIAACENMPSGDSVRPGDIVTSMNGLTIEVLNTDAEGRLILCDALTYVERFSPAVVIDIATLTGACVVALGQHKSGLFTRDDAAHSELADQLLTAGQQANDSAWRLPLGEAYNEQLNSNFADLANLSSSGGGASVAAAFLENFTRKYTWAHLDNAGTAWKSGSDKGATGRPVPLLLRFLLNRAKNVSTATNKSKARSATMSPMRSITASLLQTLHPF